MYQATDHLPSEAERTDDVDWYVRKFRLETAESDARGESLAVEVPKVRSRKWMLAVVGVAIGLSALLALATFIVSGQQ
jgi:hypothetical protein